MTNAGVRIFGCPTCGFRVDTKEQICPRCGNEFRTDTKFECPFCGDLVEAGLNRCPSCHVDYGEFKSRAAPKATDDSIDSLLMEIIKIESTTIKNEEKRFSCPKCDLLLEGTETQCPRCGKDLDVEVALQCPVCGSPVGATDVRCSECGTVFDEEAATAARTDEAKSRLEEIMSMAGTAQPEEVWTPAPAPGPEPEPEPEPVLEPEPVREPERVTMPERAAEPEQVEPEPESAPAAPEPITVPSGGGKKRTRKLKAKPKQ